MSSPVMEDWLKYNASEYTVGGKTYRNLEGQVLWNKRQIEALDLEALSHLPAEIDRLDGELEETNAYVASVGEDVAGLREDVNALAAKSVSKYLLNASWDTASKEYTLFMIGEGVKENNIIFVSPAPTSIAEYAKYGVYCKSQAEDVLVFGCKDIPVENIQVNIAIVNRTQDIGGV